MSKSRSRNVQERSSSPISPGTGEKYSPPVLDDEPLAKGGGPIAAWSRFWFTPQDAVSLHMIRIAACALFLLWMLPVAGHADAFFGLNGWFDLKAYSEISELEGGSPVPTSWSLFYLCGSNGAMVQAMYWAMMGVIVLFALGIATRLTSILTWASVVSFTANPAISGDIDILMIVLAFYLMVSYVLHWNGSAHSTSLTAVLGSTRDWLIRRRSRDDSPVYSVGATVGLRLLQLHIALIIVVSGLHKLNFGDWWAGIAFWYPLHPPMETTVEGIRGAIDNPEGYFVWLSFMAYVMLAWQLTFPCFAWRRGLWRILLLGGTVAAFIGGWIIYSEPLFALAVGVGCLSYISPKEWRWALGLVMRFRAHSQETKASSAPKPAQLAKTA